MRDIFYKRSFFLRHRRAAFEIMLCLAAGLIYIGIRSLTAGSAHTALANAARLIRFEQAMNIAWEESLQAVVISNFALVALVNWIYIWGHWPVIIATAILLFRFRPGQYRMLRNSILISAAIGFLCFTFFPVAPPRYATPELVDTVTEYSYSYRAFQPPSLTNQYAAFPSLHFGWNLLIGIAIWLATTNIILRSVAVIQTVLMAAAVVMTANHFVIDVVFGLIVVLVGLAAHMAIDSRTKARTTPGIGQTPLLHSKHGLYSSSPGRKRS